jgi:CRP-like cAMP-binding protein
MQHHRFKEGEMIIREGDQDRRLFILAEGRVNVIKHLGTKKERPIATLVAPGYFGEMAMVDNLTRSASVVATVPSHLFSLDHQDFFEEIRRHPSIALELLSTLSRRVRSLETMMIGNLGHLLSICATCKKIRNSGGDWVPLEAYISNRSNTKFTHSICPDCKAKFLSAMDFRP